MPEMIRICGVVPVYVHPHWRGGGVSRAATDLLQGLARRGHEVTAISPLIDGNRRFAPPQQTVFEGGRLRLLYSPVARATRFGTSAHGLPALLHKALTACDVMDLHGFLSPWTDCAAACASAMGVPYVIQDHGKLSPEVLRGRAFEKRVYLALRGLTLLRRAYRVLPLAERPAGFIRRYDRHLRVDVCPNGISPVDVETASGPRPLPGPYILYLGWLDPRKNIELLMRAFAQGAGSFPEWQLAIVGPDSHGLAQRLRSLANELKIASRVVMPGMATGAAKIAWLKNADLFALPSAGEGLSIAMLEAIACAVPCLLSPQCNFPEIDRSEAGETVELQENAWAEAIARWIANSDLRRRAGDNALALYEAHYTIQTVVPLLESILLRAARSGKIRDHFKD